MKNFLALTILLIPLGGEASCLRESKRLADLEVISCIVVDAQSLDDKAQGAKLILLDAKVKKSFAFEEYSLLDKSQKEDKLQGTRMKVLMSKSPAETCGVIKRSQRIYNHYKAILSFSCCDTGKSGSLSCQFDGVWGNAIPRPYSWKEGFPELKSEDDFGIEVESNVPIINKTQ